MMAMSHVLTGVSGWALVSQYADFEMSSATFGAAVIGSLLPDIDHPHSWLGRRLPFISWPLTLVIGHRGLTHSLIAVVALAATLIFYGAAAGSVVAAVSVGYLIHLAGDFITNSGIPLLWPIKRRFALPLAGTGGIREMLIVLVAVLGAAALYQPTFEQAWAHLTSGGLI